MKTRHLPSLSVRLPAAANGAPAGVHCVDVKSSPVLALAHADPPPASTPAWKFE